MAEKGIEEVEQNKESNKRDEDDYRMDKDNDEVFKLLQISIYRHRKGKESRFCLDSLNGAMGFT